MRSLTTRIKADFIKKETLGTGPTTTADSSAQRCPERDEPKRRKGGPRSVTDDGSNVSSDGPKSKTTDAETPKKSRPRSLTFTRSKNDVNAKTDRPVSHARTKSSDSSSSKSLTSSGAAQALSFMSRTPRAALPEDYISYLQKVREPQVVEVGRIQKLRRLLRNETVLWVDTFIEKGVWLRLSTCCIGSWTLSGGTSRQLARTDLATNCI